MALRIRPIATLCSIFCRQQQLPYRFRSLCSGHPHPKVANVTFDVGGQTTTIETRTLAGFRNAAAVINIGNTQVISAVASSRSDNPTGYFHFGVEEGQDMQKILYPHLIRRMISPLFPAGFYYCIKVTATVLSSNGMYDPDVMAANATSAALMISDIPWNGPIGVIRVGRVDGKFIFNPTMDELSSSDLNLVYACTKDKTLMIDGYGWEITEKDLQTGLKLAHSEALKYIGPQIRLAEEADRKKGVYKLSMVSDRTLQKIRSIADGPTAAVLNNSTYGKFQCEALDNITRTVKAKLAEECDEESLKVLPKAVDMVRNEIIRRRIIDHGLRVDGRQLDEVRPQFCKSGISGVGPGSLYFYRAITRVFREVSLKARGDASKPRGLYRHEVVYGTLPGKALLAVLPPEDDFPYVAFDGKVFDSDGSTSMATVCGACIALMYVGCPVREHVAGVSVGLVCDVDPSGRITSYRILTDLLGFEEHLVDMDLKIAGTRTGITAIQLDKIPAGISLDIICECLEPARNGRNQILDDMEEEIDARTMLDLRDKKALYKHIDRLTNDMKRSNEMFDILQGKLQGKEYELRMLKRLFSQKEADEQRNDCKNGDKEEGASGGNLPMLRHNDFDLSFCARKD